MVFTGSVEGDICVFVSMYVCVFMVVCTHTRESENRREREDEWVKI